MAKRKSGHGFYQFVSKQVLDISTDNGMTAAKRQYLAECKRKSKYAIRTRCKSFEVLLDDHEVRVVLQKAKKMGLSITRFLKLSALSDAGATNPVMIGQIREILISYYHHLEEGLLASNASPQTTDGLLLKAEHMEDRILDLLAG